MNQNTKKEIHHKESREIKFGEIQETDLLASSHFSSFFGQQNHPLVRNLRLKEKNIIADLLAKAIKSHSSFFRDLNPRALSDLQKKGITFLDKMMDKETANKIIKHFEGMNGVKNHVWSHDMERVKISSNCDIPQIAFSPKDIISNKSLLDVFLDEKVLDLVEGYLGAPGRFFHFNLLSSFPSSKTGNAQSFHRDNSHTKFCALFIYLNSVESVNGPHEYFSGTHDIDQFRLNYPNLNLDKFFDLDSDSYGLDHFFEQNLTNVRETICGSPGTCFLTDPRGIHRGMPVKSGTRWMAQARYALIPDAQAIPKIKIADDFLLDYNSRQLYTLSSIVN